MSFPHFCSRHGVTRTELLVFAGILLILTAVLAGPALAYLEKSRITHAVDNAHTISTLLSQYATDNNGVYPTGEGTPADGKSEGIARNLLENNYTPDPAIFVLGSAVAYSGKAADFSDMTASNISWDFTAGATPTTGISSTDPDLLPAVYSTGETVSYPSTAGAGFDLPLSGKGPFGLKGVVVAYKNNSASFIKGTPSGATATAPGFVSREFKGTGPYMQIKP